jgi:hypothetical protein
MRVGTLEDEVASLRSALRDQKFVDQVARDTALGAQRVADGAQRAADGARMTADSAASKARDAFVIADDLKRMNGSVCSGVSLYAHYYGNGAPSDFAGWYQEFGC